MTRTAWFNCAAGVAGDMLLGSLIDAGADRLAVMDAWGALGVDGFAATWESVQRCGVAATWTNIVVHEPAHDRDHDGHGHGHGHGHHPHRPARDVIAMIENSTLPERVRHHAIAVYQRLAEVEGAIHGQPADDVELHEVGALDSILDVVGVCAALHDLDIEQISCSPIAVGHGTVATAHGQLPNPVPAVTRLMASAGLTATGIDTTMELSTPTGVAILAVLGSGSGSMPDMTVDATGFGAGTADPAGRPNVVQAVVGESTGGNHRGDNSGQPAIELAANVDDVTGEVLAHTISSLLDAGAFDAWATPIVMKKGRPAHTVSALCNDATLDRIRSVLVDETGTLGVRATTVRRWPQSRQHTTVDVDGHSIGIKVAGGRVKVEHDDAVRAAAALGLPLRAVITRAEHAGLGVDAG